jgi:multisubunit Na+/H+ antiporter MnhG subunit
MIFYLCICFSASANKFAVTGADLFAHLAVFANLFAPVTANLFAEAAKRKKETPSV